MGHTITPKYRVEYRTNLLAMGLEVADGRSKDGKLVKMSCWSGAATAKRLEDWRKGLNASFQPGGVNAICATPHGIPHISWARIVEQKTDRVVCEVTMPMFEIA